jgi:uncharacterized protein YdcH (DUF465 family)
VWEARLKSLDEAFPGMSEEILRRRQVDQVFNEICGDFETLADELLRAEARDLPNPVRHAGNLRGSLFALKEEISQLLKSPHLRAD